MPHFHTVKKLQKSKESYKWCTDTGIIDDMSEAFPLTSSGKLFVVIYPITYNATNFIFLNQCIPMCAKYESVFFNRKPMERFYGSSNGRHIYRKIDSGINQRKNV